MGPIRRSETSINNYHTTPHDIPEERKSHQQRGGSLRSRLKVLLSTVQTVKTFPLRDRSEIKGTLFKMLNCIEMRISLMNPSFSEICNNRYNPDYQAQDSGDQPNYYFQSAP
jgi:hypothetical protein